MDREHDSVDYLMVLMVKVSQECLRAGDPITRAILALANTHHNNKHGDSDILHLR